MSGLKKAEVGNLRLALLRNKILLVCKRYSTVGVVE
jgi:hypothetical protein